MTRCLNAIWMVLAITAMSACGGGDHDHDHAEDEAPGPFAMVSKAVCVLSPTTGTELKDVVGTITFTQTRGGLLIEATITGLKPNSKHGFHVHEWGDISDTQTATATGGHYDPQGAGEHALPDIHSHGDHSHGHVVGHAGGLGNLETDSEGNATYSETFENITLTKFNAYLGRSVIIRLNEDDGSQPMGNAGPAVAQGVIGIANPEP